MTRYFIGFPGNFGFEGFDDGHRSLFEKRRFDNNDMILHFDGQAMMRASLDLVYALGHLHQIDFLLATEILIPDSHHDSAQRPL